jgi:prepilin-type N-terminal cleavage/methylation domain-containing protein
MKAVVSTNQARRGFTLIELLVVIAIIAILAALLFPVMATARAKAHQQSCAGQMAEMIRGIKMYKDDWRVYPDALYGISYNGTTLETRLYPEYVKDEKTFNCPISPTKLIHRGLVQPTNRMTGTLAPWFPQFSSYDFQYRPRLLTGNMELRYNLKWTVGAASIADDPRQLLYKNPPDSTVVSWCLYHTDMNAAGNPARDRMAVVGFLSGRVQSINADKLANWPGADGLYPWQVAPKP